MSGKFGGAPSFNGTSARVNVANTAALQLTTGMTIEAWVYPTNVSPAWRDVIYKGDDNYYLMATSTLNGARPVGGVRTTAYGEAVGTANLPVNTWTHLAATFDGANVRLFVNGAQVASVARTGTMQTSTNLLQIGGDQIYGQYFAGMIDEVRVYNQALTAAEIQTDMTTPIP
ncbi:MAG: LamG domain-containing protein [Dehalococcoidia bacterium]